MKMNFSRFFPALLLACLLPLTASAADTEAAVSKQVATATAHAGMALVATDLKMAHMHLHHVVNCLVGPSGKSFDSKAGNPCDGMGQGAIIDSKNDAATSARLNAALSDAEQGLKTTSVESAHADAKKVLNTLQAN